MSQFARRDRAVDDELAGNDFLAADVGDIDDANSAP
jgi:hypothetical protein